MKLTEALTMNPEKIKRISWVNWIAASASWPTSIEDMLADDWEVIEKTVMVSRSQLTELVNRHIAEGFNINKKFESLCMELGLM